jgi:cell division protein FtsN
VNTSTASVEEPVYPTIEPTFAPTDSPTWAPTRRPTPTAQLTGEQRSYAMDPVIIGVIVAAVIGSICAIMIVYMAMSYRQGNQDSASGLPGVPGNVAGKGNDADWYMRSGPSGSAPAEANPKGRPNSPKRNPMQPSQSPPRPVESSEIQIVVHDGTKV